MLLTLKEVATLLQISEERAAKLGRMGVLPVVKLGRQIRVSEDHLRAFVEQGGRGLPGGWRREPR